MTPRHLEECDLAWNKVHRAWDRYTDLVHKENEQPKGLDPITPSKKAFIEYIALEKKAVLGGNNCPACQHFRTRNPELDPNKPPTT